MSLIFTMAAMINLAQGQDAVEINSSTDGGTDETVLTDVTDQSEARKWAIINGDQATEEDFPMTGGMLMDAVIDFSGYELNMRMFMCSSTLIAPDVVLLAAHCLDTDALTYGLGDVNEMEIRWSRLADLTDHDGSEIADWPEDAVSASDWVIHPDFDLYNMSVGIAENNDIALLFLDEAVTDVSHAYLISEAENDQIVEGTTVQVVGWGQQEATDTFEAPPEGTYLLKMKGESFIAELGSHEFQVGAEEDDTRKCHGDSGGPSFMEVETETSESTRIIGVTSHAYDSTDCEEKGGVDTRIDPFVDWIDQEMRTRCEDGSRVWCEEQGIVWADSETQSGVDTGETDTADTAEPTGDNAQSDGDEQSDNTKSGCACSHALGASHSGLFWFILSIGIVARRR